MSDTASIGTSVPDSQEAPREILLQSPGVQQNWGDPPLLCLDFCPNGHPLDPVELDAASAGTPPRTLHLSR